jgi:hypothetical protein
MELTVITGAAQWQNDHALALIQGAARRGIVATRGRPGQHMAARTVACWGWRAGKMYRDRGANVLVMERGYLGDRFAWTSLGWNGLNGRARFPMLSDPSRFEQHFGAALKSWKHGGDYVLLIGQVPGDASLGGTDLSRWYRSTAAAAARAYGLPVAFRDHPKALERGIRQIVPGATGLGGDLDSALAGAAVAMTFNSNTAVEAVLAGCPAVTLDRGSMAWPVAGHAVDELVRPDREAWAARLAWCQWSMAEIRSGEALAPVLDVLKEAA